METLIKGLIKNPTKANLIQLKKDYAKKNKANLPTNADILAECTDKQAAILQRLIITKPQRTISGVSVVAIMSPPAPCPGKCIYCPQGPDAPKSYTGMEPATQRARHNKYDAYDQVQNRLDQFKKVGHPTDKCELIIMGGTFPALIIKDQNKFVKQAYEGFNGKRSKTLDEAQKLNETAKHRVVGLTIETRPDFFDIKQLRKIGATRVELGIQSVYPAILKQIKRGHTINQAESTTKEMKDAAFKILYHIMPGLPGSTLKSDIKMFKTIFTDERFKPDMLKIYPTLVIKGTKLYDMWKKGQYKPVDEKYMQELLAEVFRMCPKWVRIMRVQRDIPADFIEAGPKKSNLRELVQVKTKEIRSREAGRVWLKTGKLSKNVEILVEKYKANGGTEYFISAEDKKQDILVGFFRLRLTNDKTALGRELHVYGSELPLGKEAKGAAVQHRGWGKKLLAKAESIAKDAGKLEILLISGVGVREYYEKLGYKKRDTYMVKPL